MRLDVGALAGSRIYDHVPDANNRDKVVEQLNLGSLHGIVMTDRVGGCGHTLIGANHMIFLGSLYSKSSEDQAIGDADLTRTPLILGRMCREGQTRLPHAYNIADQKFAGDEVAFKVKEARAHEEHLVSKMFDEPGR